MNVVDIVRLWVDTTTKSLTTMTRIGVDVARNVVQLPPPVTSDGIEAWRRAASGYLRDILEIPDALIAGTPLSPAAARAVEVVETMAPTEEPIGPDAVRARFETLLERSTRVDDDPGEPAFLDVVAALTPDEARIIRHLANTGPAATLDLFEVSVVGRGSELVLPHVCLVAEAAGCIAPERTQVFLENLARLGLVRFSHQEVADASEYQLLQGTPQYKDEATRLRESSGVRPKGRRGRVELTPFGQEFADICLGNRPS